MDGLHPDLSRFVPGDEGRGTLWVIFSARGVPVGKFSMTNVMADLPGDKLYFNCEQNSWYLDVEEAIHARISEILAEGGYSRLLFVGTSMGGSGALMFAPRYGPERILAFSPNTLIAEPFTHSALYHRPPVRDLLPLIDDDLAARTWMTMGVFDPADAHTLMRLRRKRPAFQLMAMRSDHDTGGILGYAKAAGGMLRDFHAGRALRVPPALRAAKEDVATGLAAHAALLAAWNAPGPSTYDAVRAFPVEWRREIWRKLIEHSLRDAPAAAFVHAQAAMSEHPEFAYAIEGMVEAIYRGNLKKAPLTAEHLADYAFVRGDPMGRRIGEGTAAILGLSWPPDMSLVSVTDQKALRRARKREAEKDC